MDRGYTTLQFEGLFVAKTPTETYTSYLARNLTLRCADNARGEEGNAVPAYIKGEFLTLIVSFCL